MGIPKFFRWLTGRYPAVLQRLGSSSNSSSSNEENSSDDMSCGGLPVDHLYLDMNGLIHQCSHNNSGKVVSISFEQIFQNIVSEINRIIALVRPQQLLFIAIDGVAPRAKLNQQRTRRFRAARDAMSKSASFNSINQSGMTGYGGSMYFDSNCITPGTQFMHDLSKAMHLFIDYSMQNNPLWSRLKVHFSGSQVPGEGEHKIISFIRDLRASELYVPNTRHCVVGADADMIVLALATHEPYFIVLRDDVYYQQASKGYKKYKNYHTSSQQQLSNNGAKRSSDGSSAIATADKQRMCFVRINVLRECIATELLADLSAEHSTPHQRERLIDDFVFLTFLVGNDFLPSLPAIDIGDSAFDIIFDAYKTVMLSAEADGTSSCSYLVCEGCVDVRLLELIFSLIGATEDSLYHSQQMLKRNRSLRLKASTIDPIAAIKEASTIEIKEVPSTKLSEYIDHLEHSTAGISPPLPIDQLCLWDDDEPTNASNIQQGLMVASADEAGIGGDAESRALYYKNKFHFDVDTEEGQRRLSDVVASYLAGLQWCLSYYTRGCCSWSWFYPFHYGPFLSDMCDLQDSTPISSDTAVDAVAASFKLDSPLKPFQQLLACLPAASSRLLPPPYRWLMEHPSSPLIGFYPGEFEVDRNDKKYDYEAVVLLPFIDISLLLAAEDTHCPSNRLTPEQLELNSFGSTYCYEMVRDSTLGLQSPTASNHRLQLSERSVEILPGACFRAELPIGTASSLVDFPSLREVLLLRNSAQPVSSQSSSGARRKPTTESFPMPGRVATPSLGTSPFVKESVCSMTATTTTDSATPLLSMQSSTSATVNISMSFRIDTACSAYPFLNAIISQVTLKTAEFKPIVPNEQQQFTDAGLSQQRIMSIDCDLSDLIGYENMQAYDRYLLADVLPKMKGVLTPIAGQLLPFCVVGIDGNVRIQYKDSSSDLMHFEEFLHSSLLGSDLTVISPDNNVDRTTLVETDGSTCSSEASSNSSSTSCFSRYITIGAFHGSNADKFVTWLNSELKKLSSYMPSFTCRQLECLIEKEDAAEDRTISFKF